jgi:hypothetical protein
MHRKEEEVILRILAQENLLIEFDVDINTSDTSTPTHNEISGLITRAHARQLNN